MIFISFLLQVFVKDLRFTHYARTFVLLIPVCRFIEFVSTVNYADYLVNMQLDHV